MLSCGWGITQQGRGALATQAWVPVFTCLEPIWQVTCGPTPVFITWPQCETGAWLGLVGYHPSSRFSKAFSRGNSVDSVRAGHLMSSSCLSAHSESSMKVVSTFSSSNTPLYSLTQIPMEAELTSSWVHTPHMYHTQTHIHVHAHAQSRKKISKNHWETLRWDILKKWERQLLKKDPRLFSYVSHILFS